MRTNRVLIVLAIVTSLFYYNLWPVLWLNLFYQGTAFEWVLVYTILFRLTKNGDIFLHKGVCILLAWSFNSFLDECLFDPKAFELNEYITAAVIALIVLAYRRKSQITNP